MPIESIEKDARRDIRNLAVVVQGFANQVRQPLENLDRHLAAATADGDDAAVAAEWAAHPGLKDIVDALRAYGA